MRFHESERNNIGIHIILLLNSNNFYAKVSVLVCVPFFRTFDPGWRDCALLPVLPRPGLYGSCLRTLSGCINNPTPAIRPSVTNLPQKQDER